MGEVQWKYQQKLDAIKYDNSVTVASSNKEDTYITDITS